MSVTNFQKFGSVTTDTVTETVSCRGTLTMSAHLASGAGTWTWQFKGPDGVWRNIYGDPDGITLTTFTATHMLNVYFGGDVKVRGNASAGSSPVWDWQLIGNNKSSA